MGIRTRAALIAALIVCLAPLASAEEIDAPLAFDPARPAVGEWTGTVSWSRGLVVYGGRIDPDGRFSSGRLGRGYGGDGAWGTSGERLTLKYADGFRYEGELSGDAYGGTAYRADGRALGSFSMQRYRPDKSGPDEAP